MQRRTLAINDAESIQLIQYSASSSAKGHVVIAPAMGVTQAFYQPLAHWLSQQGFNVTTFDYRGIGESQQKPLRQYNLDILQWAKQDCSAALAQVLEQNTALPVYWLGHSLGGQIFPLIAQIEKVTKVITLASGTGYWKHNAPALRRQAPMFWYVIVPVLTRMFGYFPGAKLGMVGNLPKSVMLQWRRWCLHPEYCVGVESAEIRRLFTQLHLPLVSISFSDDEMLSQQNMQDLHALFGSTRKQLKNYSPQQFGVKRIGHLGFFREQFKQTLWPEILLPELSD